MRVMIENKTKNKNPCPKDQKKKKKTKVTKDILQQYTSAVYVGCNKLAYS